MSGVELRDMGTTAQFAPHIKRGTARLTSGQAVVIVPDTNRSTANGDDVTGVAKLFVYVSTDSSRSAYTLHQTYTTAVAFASATRYAVMSCAVRENDSLYVVYQGTDNSLRMITFNWSAGAYGAGSEQTVVAAGAITNRFRAVDIDAITPSANLIVAAYEAAASTGQGAFARAYVRMDDGTTWTRAYTSAILSTEFIRTDSEDISIAWNKAGKTANVGQFVMYYTKTHTTGDLGDTLRELSFNCSTGTVDSATIVGTWRTDLYKNNAASSRRGMLFSEASNVWIFGSAVGAAVPYFSGIRLYHNVFTGLVYNNTSVSIQQTRNTLIYIEKINNPSTAVGFEYCDSVLVIGFAGRGYLTSEAARSVVLKFSTTTSNPNVLRMDAASRVLDNGYTLNNTGVIGVFGGGNKNNSSSIFSYTFGIIYGTRGDVVSTTPLVNGRKIRAVPEDVISAPIVLAPSGTTVTTDRPTVRVQAQNANLYSSVLGKLQFQVSSDSGFVTNLQTITEDDSALNSYSATSGSTPPIRTLSYTFLSAQSLFSGIWYIRARVLDDLGGFSAWSSTATFTISHPPSALPVTPSNSTSQLYGTGSVTLGWTFSDPEQFDSQSAYRAVIIRTDTGASVYDSGKVVSSLSSITVTGLSATLKDVPLQWTVSLWDSDDVQGLFSSGTVFTLVDPPDVVVTGPAEGSTINTALPTVTWSFTVGGTRTQKAYRVRIWDLDASPDEEVADTGWVFTAVTTHAFAEQILEEGVNYRADVYVIDSVNLTDTDSNAFLTDWLPPAGVNLTVAVDEFKATLTWTNASDDPDWVGYRVYRRYMEVAIPELDVAATATTWKLVAEVTNVATSYTYRDYVLPLNRAVDYVVVQVADRFGSLLESDITVIDTVTSVGDRYYFVPEVPIGTIASFEASYVTGDAFTRDIEQNTLHVIGRGRQVQVGDDLGYSGTLTINLRNPATARSDREFIEYLSTNGAGNVFVRSPFGDVLCCSFGSVNSTRLAGVGTEDLVDLSIPYTTVFQEVPITRAGS